ncbi:hypothetical protein SLA2020_422410 [Shorea laevis]
MMEVGGVESVGQRRRNHKLENEERNNSKFCRFKTAAQNKCAIMHYHHYLDNEGPLGPPLGGPGAQCIRRGWRIHLLISVGSWGNSNDFSPYRQTFMILLCD